MKRIEIATQLLAGVLASPNLDNNKPTSLIVETVLEFADELIKQCPEESKKDTLLIFKEQERQCVNCVHYKICKEYDIEGITCSDYQRLNIKSNK